MSENLLKKANFALLYFFILLIPACGPVEKEPISKVSPGQLLADIQFLASDELKGRFPESEGSKKAQELITARFEHLGLKQFGDSYAHSFGFSNTRTQATFTNAKNLIGYIPGTKNPDQYIVVTAHYDHLGVRDGEIYNGADDNASGTSGLLAAAAWFAQNPPENSIIFMAFDAEEQGLQGARYFVENPVVSLSSIVMNVNLDMISTNFNNELYAVGTFHYPFLKPIVENAARGASVNVLFGYDSPEASQDWTNSSDHGPFHAKGIPFVYFGVEDHEHYHKSSDTFEIINQEFFVHAVETIITVVEAFDRQLDAIKKESDR